MSVELVSKNVMESELSASINDNASIDAFSLEFNRENIEKLNKNIRLVDSDEETGIDLFCYIHCETTDAPIIKQSRGVVFDGNDLVMKGYPYTIEYTKKDNENEINENIVGIFDQCVFIDSYEGSLIRMFNYSGKWYLSTNRKLDAFKSKWATKESFGSFFKKALEHLYDTNENFRNTMDENSYRKEKDNLIQSFQSTLNTDFQYMFLLLNNNQNRIVSKAPENPTVYHVGIFKNGELMQPGEDSTCVPSLKSHNFQNMDEIYNYVDNVDITRQQGIIVFAPNNIQYKIFNQEYKNLYQARGNEPSIKFRYLQVRMNKKYNDILNYLYPEFRESFELYENLLYKIAKEIHQSYIDRFIGKNYVTVPVEEFQVIRDCHSWHLQNRTENKISLNKVIDVLNQQPATNLNKMIRRKLSNENDEKPKQPKHFEKRNKSFLRKEKEE